MPSVDTLVLTAFGATIPDIVSRKDTVQLYGNGAASVAYLMRGILVASGETVYWTSTFLDPDGDKAPGVVEDVVVVRGV